MDLVRHEKKREELEEQRRARQEQMANKLREENILIQGKQISN